MTRKSKSHRVSSPKNRGAQAGHHPHIPLAGTQLQQALALHQQGDLATARAAYEAMLADNPEHAEALHLLGVAEHQSGQHASAVSRIERAIELKPDAVLFRKNIASAYRSADQLDKARKTCEDVLAVEPDEPVLHSLLGRILEQQQQWQAAVGIYRRLLELPVSPAEQLETRLHLGDCYSRLRQHTAAADCFREVLQSEPNNLLANHNLARELHFLNQHDTAITLYRKAIEIDPRCASAWNNLGVIYQTRADFAQARKCVEQAGRIAPNLPDVHNNLANILEAVGETSDCGRMFARAIELRPEYAEAHHSLGQIFLREKNFPEGWEEYRWRLRKQDHDHRGYRHPEWDGTANRDLSLLVYCEQGIGDIVMFATCLPDVLARVSRVTVEVDARMVGLFARSFPQVNVIPRPAAGTPEVTSVSGVDQQISLADLPRLFRRELADFPRQAQLLVPDSKARAKWRDRLGALGPGLKIGISWFGGKNLELQIRRKLDLPAWIPILQTPGMQFVNLQYGAAVEQRHELTAQTGIPIHDWPDSDPTRDLDDFTAKLAELDLVISIDNATVHFAGGAGVPTWCLLSAGADWRWGLSGEQTEWYASLRLFRQPRFGDWNAVVSDVALALKNQLAETSRQSAAPAIVPPYQHSHDHSPASRSTGVHPAWSSNAGATVDIRPAARPRCAVISPVGPGHEGLYLMAERSIRDACLRSPGGFREVTPFRVDDTQGQVGRSKARNLAVQEAARQGFDWLFFLDADDLMVPQAMENVAPYLEQYDAIWGQIYSFADGATEAVRRPQQLGKTDRFEDILACDPFLSLQMGHFVKTEVALRFPFHEDMNAGEDFDYYLRVWENCRCIKLDVPLFANRRGRHSSGPRSATGREWSQVVNRMLAESRQPRVHGTAPALPTSQSAAAARSQQTSPAAATHPTTMKLAIYGMMRSGTTLLCDKLTVPGRGLILLEPNIHLESRPEHLRRQLAGFGITTTDEEWADGTRQGFRAFFDRRLLPELNRLEYWGVKMVNFSRWQEFLNDYPCEHLVLCVRDIRDVVLSALDLAPKLDAFVDDAWIERRAIETARALVEISRRPHTVMRYEDFCRDGQQIDTLAAALGLPRPGDSRLGLEAVPHRLYEAEKHGNQVSSRSIGRFALEPDGPARELAIKVWQQTVEYGRQFGYEIAGAAGTTGPVRAAAAEWTVQPGSIQQALRAMAAQTEVAPPTSREIARVVATRPAAVSPGNTTPVDSTRVAPAFAERGANSSLAEHPIAAFWKQDQLENIIPRNAELGAFPEGWDVRPYLAEQIGPRVSQRILEVGCGYGRLCEAFPAAQYLGVDISPLAIQTARQQHAAYSFATIGFEDAYPQADVILAYTVMLHIDDLTIGPMLRRMCQAAPCIVVAEILGRQRWRRSGNPPVFNRDLNDYVALFRDCGFHLERSDSQPYQHYPQTEISFLTFLRQESR